MENRSTQKGSIAVVLLAIMVLLGIGIFLYVYVSNAIKSELSDEELKNKEAVVTTDIKTPKYFEIESENNELMDIKIFFPKPSLSGCSRDINEENFDFLYRSIKNTQSLGHVSTQELFKGLTEDEKSKGYWSDIPDGVKVRSMSIVDGRAYVDLNEKIGDISSCKGNLRLWQIKLTLTQFPSIDATTFSVNGETKDIFQP